MLLLVYFITVLCFFFIVLNIYLNVFKIAFFGLFFVGDIVFTTSYNSLDYVIYTLTTLIPLLLVVAIFTLAERRIMASIQRRKGPNVVGFFGFLQPFADGLKLILKEIVFPNKANKFIFVLGPSFVLFLSFIGWASMPFNLYSLSLTYSVLYILVVSSFGVYGILLSGWSSYSKYALLGALRSVAQVVSYEASIGLCLLVVVLFGGSLNLNKLIYIQMKTVWFVFPLFPLSIIFFISILAETSRAPFDLTEAEAELVAGYNVEYSAIMFVAFFLGEYTNILFMSGFFVCLFFGGSSFGLEFSVLSNTFVFLQGVFFSLKIVIIATLFIFVRANLPRFRFDQLMFVGWKVFLPITLAFILFFSSILYVVGGLEIAQVPHINSVFNYIELLSVKF